jgi:serine/threonine-protein kinase
MLLNSRYLIVQSLAQGGCGETYIAEDTYMPSKRKCVIKQFKPSQANASAAHDIKEKFRKEAEVLEVIGTHELIPELYAFFEEQRELYIVQQWIDGVTLTQKVNQEGPLDNNFVRDFLVCMLSVLSYVHSQQIIHRDIKPDNIILRKQDGMPVLIDFGVIKDLENTVVSGSANYSGTMVGSGGYTAPEQAAGLSVYASDLFSLGMIAIFLLTGKNPANLRDLQTGHIHWWSEVLNKETIDRDLVNTINKAIQHLADERFPSAEKMKKHLYNSTPRACRVWDASMHTPYMWKVAGDYRLEFHQSDFDEAMQLHQQNSGEHQRGLNWKVFN